MEKEVKRKQNPMFVDGSRVESERLYKGDYNMSVKDACKLLMCDRSWITKYIRPHVHYIYYDAWISFNQKETIWLNSKEFEKLIKASIASCTRQTICIPAELIVEDKKTFIEKLDALTKEIDDVCDKTFFCSNDAFYAIEKAYVKKCHALLRSYIKSDYKVLIEDAPHERRRSEAKAVDVSVPSFKLKDLAAVHDMKDYGDSDELIYRDLFLDGNIRLEVAIPDADGVISKKVYYIEDKCEADKLLSMAGVEKSDFWICVKYELFERMNLCSTSLPKQTLESMID